MPTTYEQWRDYDWKRAHLEKDISALSGHSLDTHLYCLAVEGVPTAESAVLCIGVGMGDWVREAVERYREVWALDVASAAVSRVGAAAFVTAPQELPSCRFDLALSYHTAMHMSDDDLTDQLAGVVRSLKPGGLLAIHYKEPLEDSYPVDNREGADDEWTVSREARMLRRRRHFDAMARRAGGAVVDVPVDLPSRFFSVRNVVAHVSKRS